jgi:hypothetical protein
MGIEMPRSSTSAREAMAGWRSVAWVLAILGAGACRGRPYAERAPDDESSSSGDTASSASTGGSTAVDATTGGGGSTGFELPEGCGDGVVEPGQYCFVAVPLPYLGPDHNKIGSAAAADFDGDGRDELVLEDFSAANVVLRLVDGAFEFDPPVTPGAPYFDMATRWDGDGDGREELVSPIHSAQGLQGEVAFIRGVGQSLQAQSEVVGAVYNVNGHPVPIDVDEDGELEFLVGVEGPPAQWGGHLRKRVGGEWVDIGPILPLPGCGATGAKAYADFDEDGHQDVVVHDIISACKPYPVEYDPAFHRVAVFRSDPETGLLEPTGTFPTGGMGEGGMWTGDFDGDGHQDVAIQIQAAIAVSLLTGRGNGMLNEPVLITELGGVVGSWRVSRWGRGDFDGDGDLEWLGGSANDGRWVLDRLLGNPSVVPMPPEFPAPMLVADFNGDGVSDFLDYSILNLGDKYVMLSVP